MTMIQYDAGRPRGCGRRSSALLSLEGHDSRTVLSIITVTGGAGLRDGGGVSARAARGVAAKQLTD